jgi:anti-anti-sigma factor
MFIELRQQYDGVYILHCEGSLVPGPERGYMQAKLDEIGKLVCARLLVDFHNVASIGSMGVTFIVAAYNAVVWQPGGRFVLTGVSPRVNHVLNLTRISTVIPRASDLASGLAILGAESSKRRSSSPTGTFPLDRSRESQAVPSPFPTGVRIAPEAR